MNQYIFVDFDGVLVLEKDKYTFSTEAIGVLRKICGRTGAKVVVCSSWREETLAKTVEHLPAALRELIVSQTPDLSGKKATGVHFAERVSLRYREIWEWMAHHKVDSYIVIDDEEEHYENSALGWCRLLRTDPKAGLVEELEQQAVMMLEHPWQVTDADTHQRCRILQNEKGSDIYEYEQQNSEGDTVSDVIDLDDYTLDEAFEKKYLSSYGYTFEKVKRYYKDS